MWSVYITTPETPERSILITDTMNHQWLVEFIDKLLSCEPLEIIKIVVKEV